MHSVFIGDKKPQSKQDIKNAIANGEKVRLKPTSIHRKEFDGLITDMPEGYCVLIAGPCPYTHVMFYGKITKVNGKVVVI